jgi:hypothetical protein
MEIQFQQVRRIFLAGSLKDPWLLRGNFFQATSVRT